MNCRADELLSFQQPELEIGRTGSRSGPDHPPGACSDRPDGPDDGITVLRGGFRDYVGGHKRPWRWHGQCPQGVSVGTDPAEESTGSRDESSRFEEKDNPRGWDGSNDAPLHPRLKIGGHERPWQWQGPPPGMRFRDDLGTPKPAPPIGPPFDDADDEAVVPLPRRRPSGRPAGPRFREDLPSVQPCQLPPGPSFSPRLTWEQGIGPADDLRESWFRRMLRRLRRRK